MRNEMCIWLKWLSDNRRCCHAFSKGCEQKHWMNVAEVMALAASFGYPKGRHPSRPCGRMNMNDRKGERMKTKHLLALAFSLIYLLTACGSPALPSVSPDRLQVIESEGTPQTKTSLVTNPENIQKLYTALVALPGVPPFQGCSTIGGPTYDLTFFKDGKVVLKAQADRGGCGTVTLPQNDQRQPDDQFWLLLTQAIQS